MTTDTPRAAFLEQVKASFDYLFAEYGFTVAGSMEDPQRQYAEVLLESPQCDIKFSLSRQDWEMLMAPRSGSPDQAEWVSAGLVFNYVTRAPVNIEDSLKPRPVLAPEDSLRQWAETFRSVAGQAIAFFNPDGFAQRMEDFRNFVAEQNAEARRQLMAWQAGQNAQA